MSATYRRVHISQTTKDSLCGEFDLEQGNGGERCEYLLEKGIETYLVLVPSKKEANGLSGNVREFQHCCKMPFSWFHLTYCTPSSFLSLSHLVHCSRTIQPN